VYTSDGLDLYCVYVGWFRFVWFLDMFILFKWQLMYGSFVSVLNY